MIHIKRAYNWSGRSRAIYRSARMYVFYRKMQSRYIDNICHLSLITPICVDVAWHNYSVLTLSWFQGWTSRMHPAVNVIRFDSLFFVLRFFFLGVSSSLLGWTMVQSGFSHGEECRTCIVPLRVPCAVNNHLRTEADKRNPAVSSRHNAGLRRCWHNVTSAHCSECQSD